MYAGRNLEFNRQGCLPCLLKSHLRVAKTLAHLQLSDYGTCAMGTPREDAEYLWTGRPLAHDAGTQHIPVSQTQFVSDFVRL